MKKSLFTLALLFLSVPFCFASNNKIDTQMYMFDAKGGPVTEKTKKIIVLIKYIGNIPTSVDTGIFSSIDSINCVDFLGKKFSLYSLGTPTTGLINPSGDGELTQNLGIYAYSTGKGWSAPQLGLVCNLNDHISFGAHGPTYPSINIQATSIIDFSATNAKK